MYVYEPALSKPADDQVYGFSLPFSVIRGALKTSCFCHIFFFNESLCYWDDLNWASAQVWMTSQTWDP